MSAVATSRRYIAPIIHDSMRPSVDKVGDDVSSLDSQSWCFFPSANPLPLIVTSSLFSFISIRYARNLLSCSQLRSWGFLGLTTLWPWNCCSSFRTTESPFFPKTLSLWLILHCVSMVSLVMMLIGGVGLTKEEITLTTLTYYFAILCSSLEPTIRLFHPMERQVDLL